MDWNSVPLKSSALQQTDRLLCMKNIFQSSNFLRDQVSIFGIVDSLLHLVRVLYKPDKDWLRGRQE